MTPVIKKYFSFVPAINIIIDITAIIIIVTLKWFCRKSSIAAIGIINKNGTINPFLKSFNLSLFFVSHAA